MNAYLSHIGALSAYRLLILCSLMLLASVEKKGDGSAYCSDFTKEERIKEEKTEKEGAPTLHLSGAKEVAAGSGKPPAEARPMVAVVYAYPVRKLLPLEVLLSDKGRKAFGYSLWTNAPPLYILLHSLRFYD